MYSCKVNVFLKGEWRAQVINLAQQPLFMSFVLSIINVLPNRQYVTSCDASQKFCIFTPTIHALNLRISVLLVSQTSLGVQLIQYIQAFHWLKTLWILYLSNCQFHNSFYQVLFTLLKAIYRVIIHPTHEIYRAVHLESNY